MANKVLPGNETVLLIPAIEKDGVPYLVYPGGQESIAAPTSALLNHYIGILTNGSAGWGHGGNISCALRDDSVLRLDDSDTDSDRTICSIGQSETPTFYNFTNELNIFRDEDVDSTTSVFVMSYDLIRAPDIKYVAAHRIGRRNTENTAAGETWDFYYSWTDNPVPIYDDGGNQLVTATLVPKSIVNINYELAA